MKKNQFNNTTKLTIVFVLCSFFVILVIGINQSLKGEEEVILEETEELSQEEEILEEELLQEQEDDQQETEQQEEQEVTIYEQEADSSNDTTIQEQEESQEVEVETQEEIEVVEMSKVSIVIYGVDETLASGTIEVEQASTVYDVLLEYTTQQSMALKTSGIGTSIYVKGIGGLNEFDYGGRSGWTYTVNGNYLSVSCGAYEIGDGDIIEWIYANYE